MVTVLGITEIVVVSELLLNFLLEGLVVLKVIFY